jgi:hypothetical protein
MWTLKRVKIEKKIEYITIDGSADLGLKTSAFLLFAKSMN